MARKPASMYRQIKGQSYTRKEYLGGIPHNKITQYDLGNLNTPFQISTTLKVKNRVQIRHSSLEAGRVAANRLMNKKVGLSNYHLKIRVHPHNVIRENKIATGAGADRISSGMRASFGKNVGTAARLKKDQSLMTIKCNSSHFLFAKEALRKASTKFPIICYTVIEKGSELIK